MAGNDGNAGAVGGDEDDDDDDSDGGGPAASDGDDNDDGGNDAADAINNSYCLLSRVECPVLCKSVYMLDGIQSSEQHMKLDKILFLFYRAIKL